MIQKISKNDFHYNLICLHFAIIKNVDFSLIKKDQKKCNYIHIEDRDFIREAKIFEDYWAYHLKNSLPEKNGFHKSLQILNNLHSTLFLNCQKMNISSIFIHLFLDFFRAQKSRDDIYIAPKKSIFKLR